MSLVEELGGGAEREHRFKIKKRGVIPPKRRSVKMMMFHKLVKSVSSVFHSCCHPRTSGTASALQPVDSLEGEVISMVKTKNKKIFPGKDRLPAIVSQNDPSTN